LSPEGGDSNIFKLNCRKKAEDSFGFFLALNSIHGRDAHDKTVLRKQPS